MFARSITAPDSRFARTGQNQDHGATSVVSTSLMSLVTPVACWNYRFIVKNSNHYTNFKAIYFISTKEKVLTPTVKFMQDLVLPLRLRLLHFRVDGGGRLIANYYRDY